MKNLYLLGAGGFGREVLSILLAMQQHEQTWNIMGFLDDTKDPLKGKPCDAQVVGSIQDYSPKKNDVFALCVADPAGKERIVKVLEPRGAVFATIAPPSAYLGQYCTVGEGAVIMPFFGMTVNCSIGRFATLQLCGIGHDAQIGDFVTISAHAHLLGNVRIGNRVFLGANAVIAPNTHIEDDAYVGVGSVVLKRVRQGEKVFGNPAREIGL